ncbi:hypothetical protein [Burkholderia ambifaria]|uniref:hypothetical protein n=1 Tax=Burkholderia ambifaria TaxID=152480 RepID=UPI00158AE4C7|nr:hypothetical protein [Burkholderia ambifaria]
MRPAAPAAGKRSGRRPIAVSPRDPLAARAAVVRRRDGAASISSPRPYATMNPILPTLPHVDAADAADHAAPAGSKSVRPRTRSLATGSAAFGDLAPARRTQSEPPPTVRRAIEPDRQARPAADVMPRDGRDDGASLTDADAPVRHGAMADIWRKLDFASLLKLPGTHDDHGFLDRVRNEETGDGSIPKLLGKLGAIEQMIEGAGFPAELTRTLKAQVRLTRRSLQEIETDKHPAKRAAMALLPNLILGAAALAVALKSNPRQQLFASELFALTFKAVLEGIGMALTPTTGAGLVKERVMARNYANTLQALEFVLPTFVKPSAHLNRKTWVDLLATVVSTTGLFAGFMGTDIKNQFDKRFRKGVDPALAKLGATLHDDRRGTLATVDGEAKALHRAALGMRDASIGGDTSHVSPHLGKQIQLVLRACGRLAEMTSHTLGEGRAAAGGGGEPPDARANPDRNAKIALALFTAAVTASTALLTFPDTIGVVDLASDAVFTSILMAVLANNPDVSRHDALEEFKTFAGLSVVLLAVLTGNKLGHDFIDRGDRGLAVGASVLVLLNATVPGIVGEKAAKAVERALAGASSMRVADLTEPLRALGDLLHRSVFVNVRRTPAASVAGASPDEAGADTLERHRGHD